MSATSHIGQAAGNLSHERGLLAASRPRRVAANALDLENVAATVRKYGLDAAVAGVEALGNEPVEMQSNLWHYLANLLEPVDPRRAIAFYERAFDLMPSLELARLTGRLARSHGSLTVAERMTRYTLGETSGRTPTAKELHDLANLQGMTRLLRDGFPLPPQVAAPSFAPVTDSAIYLLHNSLPYASGGYATRAHGLLRGIASAGMSVVAYTRHGFPHDLPEYRTRLHRPEVPYEDCIDGIPYRRLHAISTGRDQLPIDRYLELYAQRVVNVALAERPAVLHSASFFLNGLAAATAGRLLGLPTIYEIRGLTEVTKVSRNPWWQDSDEYQMYERLETAAADSADHVFTITQAMKEEFVRRGIEPGRMTVVPNCVDADRFQPIPRDAELEQRLGLRDTVVIGYVGSFVDYEGLDDLLAAARMLRNRGVAFKLLLVGDGVEFERIRAMIDELALWDQTILTGRVPFSEAQRYYSLIDIAPLPRKPLPVTEMVSPLKPFEAMAMEKALVVSSVNALAEIVIDGETGLVFEKGQSESLAAVLETLVKNDTLRYRLGKNARNWVKANRSWERTGGVVADVYRELQERARVESAGVVSYTFRPPVNDLQTELELQALHRRLAQLEARDAPPSRNKPGVAGSTSFKPVSVKPTGTLATPTPEVPSPAEHGRAEHAPHNTDALVPRPLVDTWVAFEDLGAKRSYQPTFGVKHCIDDTHRRYLNCPLVRGVQIDVGIPGALRREDALKLYELAYHVPGDVLELGTGYGLSTSIIGEAIRASGRQSTVMTIDRDRRKVRAAAGILAARKLNKLVKLVCKDGKAAGARLSAKKRRFDLIFVDHSSDYHDVVAACGWLPDLLRDGGFLLFHDYNERRNRDEVGDGGVFQAVQDGLSSRTFEFFGVFGSTGLYRKNTAPPYHEASQ